MKFMIPGGDEKKASGLGTHLELGGQSTHINPVLLRRLVLLLTVKEKREVCEYTYVLRARIQKKFDGVLSC